MANDYNPIKLVLTAALVSQAASFSVTRCTENWSRMRNINRRATTCDNMCQSHNMSCKYCREVVFTGCRGNEARMGAVEVFLPGSSPGSSLGWKSCFSFFSATSAKTTQDMVLVDLRWCFKYVAWCCATCNREKKHTHTHTQKHLDVQHAECWDLDNGHKSSDV